MTSNSCNSSESRLLESINSPQDLKNLPSSSLVDLADEIRSVLIASLAESGGHLGPNLGVVELTLALHSVFNVPQDQFLFDVSHQGYIHKLLTGRKGRFSTIRQFEGLSGFLNREESVYDVYGAGHAGTALSAALGFAKARDLLGKDNHIVAVAGDAAFTCGTTLEALNNISATTKKMIIILNDNEWSIDQNVGALDRHFNRLKTHPIYEKVRRYSSEILQKIGSTSVQQLAQRVEESAKGLLLPNLLFEDFNISYFGPLDGHDTLRLINVLQHLKTLDRPVVLHIITEKGRGYQPAVDNPSKFHGLGAYQVENGKTAATKLPTYSEVFSKQLVEEAQKDTKIVAITAAMSTGTKLNLFKEDIPERFFDVGIAEEHAALFACGLAAGGLKPFLVIYSTFMQRAYDMIIHDMAIQKLPVRLCMDRAGCTGDDGPTHHGLFDIAYLRPIPNLVHMQPKNEIEFKQMIVLMTSYQAGPIAIRYPRGSITGTEDSQGVLFSLGEAEVVSQGEDIMLIGLGNFFAMAQIVKERMEALGYSVSLINPRFIKPLDEECLTQYAKKSRIVMTFEDHVEAGGFGDSVRACLSRYKINVPVEVMAWPNEFIQHGKVEQLQQKHGLTVEAAVDRLSAYLD